MEPEEEFDFTGAVERVHGMQGGLAARALEWIGAPDPEDEVAPKRAHRAGGVFWGRRDDRWFRCGLFFSGGHRGRGGWAWHAAAFVRVDSVVTDRLLAPWGDVINGGCEEIGGFEDFKVALGAPTPPGAVDDGMGLGIPMDFLE